MNKEEFDWMKELEETRHKNHLIEIEAKKNAEMDVEAREHEHEKERQRLREAGIRRTIQSRGDRAFMESYHKE